MSEKTFEARYCRERGVSTDRYEKLILRNTLYPHARWFYYLVRMVSPDHFAADLDLIRSVAKLTRLRDFNNDVEEFVHHPANIGASRRTFNLRISTKKLRRMVRATLHSDKTEEADHTAVPFAKTGQAKSGSAEQATHVLVA